MISRTAQQQKSEERSRFANSQTVVAKIGERQLVVPSRPTERQEQGYLDIHVAVEQDPFPRTHVPSEKEAETSYRTSANYTTTQPQTVQPAYLSVGNNTKNGSSPVRSGRSLRVSVYKDRFNLGNRQATISEESHSVHTIQNQLKKNKTYVTQRLGSAPDVNYSNSYGATQGRRYVQQNPYQNVVSDSLADLVNAKRNIDSPKRDQHWQAEKVWNIKGEEQTPQFNVALTKVPYNNEVITQFDMQQMMRAIRTSVQGRRGKTTLQNLISGQNAEKKKLSNVSDLSRKYSGAALSRGKSNGQYGGKTQSSFQKVRPRNRNNENSNDITFGKTNSLSKTLHGWQNKKKYGSIDHNQHRGVRIKSSITGLQGSSRQAKLLQNCHRQSSPDSHPMNYLGERASHTEMVSTMISFPRGDSKRQTTDEMQSHFERTREKLQKANDEYRVVDVSPDSNSMSQTEIGEWRFSKNPGTRSNSKQSNTNSNPHSMNSSLEGLERLAALARLKLKLRNEVKEQKSVESVKFNENVEYVRLDAKHSQQLKSVVQTGCQTQLPTKEDANTDENDSKEDSLKRLKRAKEIARTNVRGGRVHSLRASLKSYKLYNQGSENDPLMKMQNNSNEKSDNSIKSGSKFSYNHSDNNLNSMEFTYFQNKDTYEDDETRNHPLVQYQDKLNKTGDFAIERQQTNDSHSFRHMGDPPRQKSVQLIKNMSGVTDLNRSKVSNRTADFGFHKHRSTMKGKKKYPTEFRFFNEDPHQGIHQQCMTAKQGGSLQISMMIEYLDKQNKVQTELSIQKHAEQIPHQSNDVLKGLMHEKFDIRKAYRQVNDENENHNLDEFFHRENNPLYAMQPKHMTVSRSKIDVAAFQKQLNVIERIKDDKENCSYIDRSRVKESSIPLEIFYNDKVERIRTLEYSKNKPPEAIHFDIHDSYSGPETTKQIRIESVTAPKAYTFEVDMIEGNRQKHFETVLEEIARKKRLLTEKPLMITDFARGQKDNNFVLEFIKALRMRLHLHEVNMAQYMKHQKSKKSEQQVKDKLTKQLVGMRDGNQYDFERLENTEIEEDYVRTHVSDEDNVAQMLAQARKNSNDIDQLNTEAPYQYKKTNKKPLYKPDSDDSFESQVSNISSVRSLNEATPIPQASQDRRVSKLMTVRNVDGRFMNLGDSSKHLEQTKEDDDSSSNQSIGKLQRQAMKFHSDKALKYMPDMKKKETVFGLTKGIDFVSIYEQNKAIRKKKDEENKELTKYEGKVPVNQRLVLLTTDFLEATKDFDPYEMFKWRSAGVESGANHDQHQKASKTLTLVKQLFKKYQLEIIRPNLEYVINKYQTAIDGYDPAVIQKDFANETAYSKVRKDYIDFRSSPTKEKNKKVGPADYKKMQNIKFNEPRHYCGGITTNIDNKSSNMKSSIIETTQGTFMSNDIENEDLIHTLQSEHHYVNTEADMPAMKPRDEVVLLKKPNGNEVKPAKKQFQRPAFEKLNSIIYNVMQEDPHSKIPMKRKLTKKKAALLSRKASSIITDVTPTPDKTPTGEPKGRAALKSQETVPAKGSCMRFASFVRGDSTRQLLQAQLTRKQTSYSPATPVIPQHQRKVSLPADTDEGAQKADKGESWFTRLDWTDENKFAQQGAQQSETKLLAKKSSESAGSKLSQVMGRALAKQVASLKSDVKTPLTRQSTTVIGKMLGDSKKQMDSDFDHMKIRQTVVAEKSMFKGSQKVAELISNEATFLKSLKGESHHA